MLLVLKGFEFPVETLTKGLTARSSDEIALNELNLLL
jgi:hypothetical protein